MLASDLVPAGFTVEMDTVSYCLVIEEVSRVCASTGVILSVNNSLVCDPLLKFGSEAQKEEFLTPLASGSQWLGPNRAGLAYIDA